MKNQEAIIRNRLRDRFLYPLVLFVLVLALLANSWIERRQKYAGAFATPPFPYVMDSWRGYDLAIDPKAIELLNPDLVIFRRYENPERIPADLYLIVYYQQQRDRTFHSPANCYPGGGWNFQNKEAITLTGLRNPEFTILGRKTIIQKGIDSRVMYYWFFAGGQAASNEYKTKLLTMYNAIVTGRTDGGLITVSGAITDQERLEKEFLPRIIDHFAEFRTH